MHHVLSAEDKRAFSNSCYKAYDLLNTPYSQFHNHNVSPGVLLQEKKPMQTMASDSAYYKMINMLTLQPVLKLKLQLPRLSFPIMENPKSSSVF